MAAILLGVVIGVALTLLIMGTVVFIRHKKGWGWGMLRKLAVAKQRIAALEEESTRDKAAIKRLNKQVLGSMREFGKFPALVILGHLMSQDELLELLEQLQHPEEPLNLEAELPTLLLKHAHGTDIETIRLLADLFYKSFVAATAEDKALPDPHDDGNAHDTRAHATAPTAPAPATGVVPVTMPATPPRADDSQAWLTPPPAQPPVVGRREGWNPHTEAGITTGAVGVAQVSAVAAAPVLPSPPEQRRYYTRSEIHQVEIVLVDAQSGDPVATPEFRMGAMFPDGVPTNAEDRVKTVASSTWLKNQERPVRVIAVNVTLLTQ